MAYKPFGEKLNLDKDGKTTTKASHTNRGYTGHEHIEETNLINMNARLYDPTIARFISADSIIPYMYDTQSFNRYSYVRNNPLKYVDPSGHFSLSSIGSSISSALKDTGGGLSTTFKDAGGSIAYNKYNIYGVVLIVVGIIVIAETWGGSELAGGIGGGLITAGIGMLNYKPDEEESQQNQIYIGTGGSSGVPDFTVVEWGGGSQSQNEQEQYIVNNASQGTHSVTTGNKLNNGASTNSFVVTIGDYSNVNGSGVGNNVLGVDRVENNTNGQKGFFDGVCSVGIGLTRFGDYAARISGFRDWQNGSVVMRSYYQNQAIRETKYTYGMGKYILGNSSARSIFFNSVYGYASNNKAFTAGRFMTGGVMVRFGGTKGSMAIPPSALYGDMMYGSSQIDDFARSIILGY